MKRSKTRARTTKSFVVLSAVLALGSLGLGVFALAAPSVPAPTISSKPANPTNATSASFTYTDSSSITQFQCALDDGVFYPCGSTRPSTHAYPDTQHPGPLSQGSHTFQVRAVSGTQASSATSYTWTIDTATPLVVSINRADPNPTNQSAVHWTVLFSEAVQGVDATDFYLVNGGLLLPLITGVSGSGSTYTVTATTGAVVPSGTLGLNLHNNGSIRDLAGNVLSSPSLNHDVTGEVYNVDKVSPPKPVIDSGPDNPNGTAISTFTFHDSEAGVGFQCEVDNSPWQYCSSPATFVVDTSSNQLHQFEVRAVDAAGNVSPVAEWDWKVDKNLGFTIQGSVPNPMYPGSAFQYIPIALTNPQHFALKITGLTVSVGSSPAGCPGSTNLAFIQSSLSSSDSFTVPAQSTVNLPQAYQPQVQLKDLPMNQNACKNGTFQLSYSGTATR